jgi:hypothetical protein
MGLGRVQEAARIPQGIQLVEEGPITAGHTVTRSQSVDVEARRFSVDPSGPPNSQLTSANRVPQNTLNSRTLPTER